MSTFIIQTHTCVLVWPGWSIKLLRGSKDTIIQAVVALPNRLIYLLAHSDPNLCFVPSYPLLNATVIQELPISSHGLRLVATIMCRNTRLSMKAEAAPALLFSLLSTCKTSCWCYYFSCDVLINLPAHIEAQWLDKAISTTVTLSG